MHRQIKTERAIDWHDEPVFNGDHRKQTRYEQRTIRAYYKRAIEQELDAISSNFLFEMPEPGEPDYTDAFCSEWLD